MTKVYFTAVLVFGILISFTCTNVLADVSISGVRKSGRVPAGEAKGLIALIVASGGASCSRIRIKRASDPKDTTRIIDTWHIVAAFGDDFALEDGDQISAPEHIFPCLEFEKYNAALRKFLEAKAKSKTAPADWSKTLEAAGSSCGRASLREPEKNKK